MSDLSFHDNLAVFTSILIARHCFSLQDMLSYVALPSLVTGNPAFGGKYAFFVHRQSVLIYEVV